MLDEIKDLMNRRDFDSETFHENEEVWELH